MSNVGYIETIGKSALVPWTIMKCLQTLVTLSANYHRWDLSRTVWISILCYTLLATIGRCQTIIGRVYFAMLFVLMGMMAAFNWWIEYIVFEQSISSAMSAVLAVAPPAVFLII